MIKIRSLRSLGRYRRRRARAIVRDRSRGLYGHGPVRVNGRPVWMDRGE